MEYCIDREDYPHFGRSDLEPRGAGSLGMVAGRTRIISRGEVENDTEEKDSGEPPLPEGADLVDFRATGPWSDGTDDPRRPLKVGDSRTDRDPCTGENVVPK